MIHLNISDVPENFEGYVIFQSDVNKVVSVKLKISRNTPFKEFKEILFKNLGKDFPLNENDFSAYYMK